MLKRIFVLLLAIICLFVACKEQFAPVLPSGNKGLLVVEGYVNLADSTTIKLSRTLNLGDTIEQNVEKGATVQIEGEDHSVVKLDEAAPGTYSSARTGQLNKEVSYRLYIKTTNGREYATGYNSPVMTPGVDSIYYHVKNDSLKLFFDTHDPRNKVQYYRWNYRETWAINTLYTSVFEYKNGQIVERDPSVNIKHCWGKDASVGILLGSTAAFGNNEVRGYNLPSFPLYSERLSDLLAVEVTQYGLSERGYEYLQNIKKNTNQLGGIYDAQPSELPGNVYCMTDASEQVVGYVETGLIQKKRIFIHRADLNLPDWLDVLGGACPIQTIASADMATINKLISEGYGFIDSDYRQDHYRLSPLGCIDCTIKGNNVKPDFWPE